MAINVDKIAKGEAIQKLIDLLAQVKKESDLQDDEIRALFASDEMTELTENELLSLADANKLEPGHKYKVDDTIYTAASANTLEPLVVGPDKVYYYSDVLGALQTPDSTSPALEISSNEQYVFLSIYGLTTGMYVAFDKVTNKAGIYEVKRQGGTYITTFTPFDEFSTGGGSTDMTEITAADVEAMFNA